MFYKINVDSLDEVFHAIFIKIEKDKLDKNMKTLMSGLFGMIEKEAEYSRHLFNEKEKELK